MLELRRSQRSPTASLLSSKRCPKGPLASSLPPAKRPQSKSDMFQLFPYNQKDYFFSSSLNVWYGIRISRVVASVWPLQGHGNQRLGPHTLTSQDADAGDKYKHKYKYKYYTFSDHMCRENWQLFYCLAYLDATSLRTNKVIIIKKRIILYKLIVNFCPIMILRCSLRIKE